MAQHTSAAVIGRVIYMSITRKSTREAENRLRKSKTQTKAEKLEWAKDKLQRAKEAVEYKDFDRAKRIISDVKKTMGDSFDVEGLLDDFVQ